MTEGFKVTVTWQPLLAFINGRLVEFVHKCEDTSFKIEVEPLTTVSVTEGEQS